MNKYLLAGAGVVLVAVFFLVSISLTGYVSYKVGYKNGLKDMAEYVIESTKEKPTASKPDAADPAESDENTGNVGHFGS